MQPGTEPAGQQVPPAAQPRGDYPAPGPPWVPPPSPGPRWGLGDAFIGMGLFFLVQLAVGFVLGLFLVLTGSVGDDLFDGDDTTTLLLVAAPLGWAVLIGWPWWVSRRKGQGRMSRDFGLGMRPMDLLLGLGGGVLCVMAAAGVSLLYLFITGDDPPTNTDIITSDPSRPLQFLALFAVIAVGTPIAEEIFFRGLVMGAARKRWGTAVSVVFSSALFGLFHVQTDPLSWAFVAFVTGCYGVVFAMTRVWSEGRLAAPIVAHMVVNAFAVVLITFT